MNCRDATELANDHIDGALGPVDDASIRRHLALCPGCARYVHQLAVTVTLLGRLRAPAEAVVEGGDRVGA